MATSDKAARKKLGRPPFLEGTPSTYTVRLPEDLAQALERLAEAEGLSLAQVLRAAVADYLKRKRAL